MYQKTINKDLWVECPICKKVFQKSEGRRVYCSDTCAEEGKRIKSKLAYAKWYSAKKRKKTKKCMNCGADFITTGRYQYCSYCRSGKLPKESKAKPRRKTLEKILAKMIAEGYTGTYGKYIAEGRDKL